MIYSRLVEGRFPKWRDVFPKRREAVQIELAVGPLYAALRQAAIVANDESRGIDFAFVRGFAGAQRFHGGNRTSRGSEMPVGYAGPTLTVSLDHRFVADFLKVLDPEKTFTFDMENTDSAALMTTTTATVMS